MGSRLQGTGRAREGADNTASGSPTDATPTAAPTFACASRAVTIRFTFPIAVTLAIWSLLHPRSTYTANLPTDWEFERTISQSRSCLTRELREASIGGYRAWSSQDRAEAVIANACKDVDDRSADIPRHIESMAPHHLLNDDGAHVGSFVNHLLLVTEYGRRLPAW